MRWEDQTLAQLLKEADVHFKAQQYLKPVNQNAYVLYQAVLALEPENEVALQRIDQMKAFYRENGENYFAKKVWSKALSFFERYYLIDTDTKEVNNKMKICREKLAEARAESRKARYAKGSQGSRKSKPNGHQTPAEKKEEIKRMLEESGTESSWIMKYLFEDQKEEKDDDKPW